MPRPTETWEGCRWTRTDPPVNVESSEPTDHQLLFRKKWTVVYSVLKRDPKDVLKVIEIQHNISVEL